MHFKTSNHFKWLMKCWWEFIIFTRIRQKGQENLKHFQTLWRKLNLSQVYKTYGRRWIDHKFRVMEILLSNYGSYMAHIESLCQTDSQATKRAELLGFVKKWKHASFPIHTAIFLDVLSPIPHLSIAFQQEEHDPVKAVWRIQEFKWTMAKLKILTELSFEGQNMHLTHYKQFLDKIEAQNDGWFYYQDVKLSKYTDKKKTVSTFYVGCIMQISQNVERRFKNLLTSPVFLNLVSLLDISIWPIDDENLTTFGEDQILELIKHFNDILLSNSCNIYLVQTEWDRLKNHIR